jgi:hypothetical protein
MRRFCYIAASLVLSLFLWWSLPPQSAMAQEDSPVKYILLDTFYGLLAGALVGVAISAPQNDPDWRQNIGSGAAIGAIAGLMFGIVYEGKPLLTSRAVLDVEGSKAKLQLPTVQAIAQENEKQAIQTSYHVNLLQYHF